MDAWFYRRGSLTFVRDDTRASLHSFFRALILAISRGAYGLRSGFGPVPPPLVRVDVEEKDAASDVPHSLRLHQNYPNPFNPETRIVFDLPEPGAVSLTVYNVLGQEVAVLVDDPLAAGRHVVRFAAGHLPSGTYLYRIQAGSYQSAMTMALIR